MSIGIMVMNAEALEPLAALRTDGEPVAGLGDDARVFPFGDGVSLLVRVKDVGFDLQVTGTGGLGVA